MATRTAPMNTTSQVNVERFQSQVKLAGVLIATGIVFGDIGTSPLYTYTAVFNPGELINPAKALGVLSCVIWTLTLQTTIKYILITLQADNHGEGGIFSAPSSSPMVSLPRPSPWHLPLKG